MTQSIAIQEHRRTSSGCARRASALPLGGLRAVQGGGNIPRDWREQPWSPIAPQEPAAGLGRAARPCRPARCGVVRRRLLV